MKVYAFESKDWPAAESNGLTKQACVTAIEQAHAAVVQLLPTLSDNLNIAVRPYFSGIVPEYGTSGYTRDSEFIELWFDKTVPHGTHKTLDSLYRTVFHEGNHAARWNSIAEDYRLIEGAIFEGLATVFERQYAHYEPLYGMYEDDETMARWLEEIQAAGTDWSKREELFFGAQGGRRWLGYKTGTWIVDKAMAASEQSVIELTTLSADEIIALSGL